MALWARRGAERSNCLRAFQEYVVLRVLSDTRAGLLASEYTAAYGRAARCLTPSSRPRGASPTTRASYCQESLLSRTACNGATRIRGMTFGVPYMTLMSSASHLRRNRLAPLGSSVDHYPGGRPIACEGELYSWASRRRLTRQVCRVTKAGRTITGRRVVNHRRLPEPPNGWPRQTRVSERGIHSSTTSWRSSELR